MRIGNWLFHYSSLYASISYVEYANPHDWQPDDLAVSGRLNPQLGWKLLWVRMSPTSCHQKWIHVAQSPHYIILMYPNSHICSCIAPFHSSLSNESGLSIIALLIAMVVYCVTPSLRRYPNTLSFSLFLAVFGIAASLLFGSFFKFHEGIWCDSDGYLSIKPFSSSHLMWMVRIQTKIAITLENQTIGEMDHARSKELELFTSHLLRCLPGLALLCDCFSIEALSIPCLVTSRSLGGFFTATLQRVCSCSYF